MGDSSFSKGGGSYTLNLIEPFWPEVIPLPPTDPNMTNNAWNQTINLRFRDPESIYAMLKKFRPQFNLPAGTSPKNWFASQADPETQQYLSTNLTATANGFELQQRLAMGLDPN